MCIRDSNNRALTTGGVMGDEGNRSIDDRLGKIENDLDDIRLALWNISEKLVEPQQKPVPDTAVAHTHEPTLPVPEPAGPVKPPVKPAESPQTPKKPHATPEAVSYTHLRAHETVLDLVCRLL